MADLDTELSNRLSKLAAAVPVSSGRLDPVHRGAVAARQRVRMAWVTPLVLLVLAALVASAFGFRPLDVGDEEPTGLIPTEALLTEPPENAGLENAQCDETCDYLIAIRSDKRIYRESDAIQITGTLTYRGATERDLGDLRALVFSVAEPVHGIILDGAQTLQCSHAVLEPGQRIEGPFWKSGGVSTSDPDFEFKWAYLQDPILRLPPGAYHIRVRGAASEGECGIKPVQFATEIEITVLPDDARRTDLLTYTDRLQMCAGAHHRGRLIRDDDSGLGIELPSGQPQSVIWPYRFSAWESAERAVLIDDVGRTVAIEGQLVSFDGMDEPGWRVGAWCQIKGE